MLKIAQISDLHIGGDHNGKYQVKENFEKVVNSIPSDTSLVVLTGDLVDADQPNAKENYEYVKEYLEDHLPCDFVAIGGNHDDIEMLRDVFADMSFCDDVFNVNFINEGVFLSFVETSSGTLTRENAELIKEKAIVFTHYPLVKVEHAFMNKYSLSNLEEIKDILLKKEIKEIFCGHFHCAKSEYKDVNVHVAPATQCQIDSMSEQFSVSSFKAGYLMIEINEGKVTQEARFV